MAPVSSRPISLLLVDADPSRARALAEDLASDPGRGPRIVSETVEELAEGLKRVSRGGVDAVVLDLVLPDSDGLATLERALAFAPEVPILVLTDLADESLAVAAVQGGAQDYLVRDEVDTRLLVRAIRHAIERHRLLSALRSLSLIDDLTGLYNRRGFMELGTQFLKLSRRSGKGAVVLFLDLDGFKAINDEHGHHVGDRALAHVADVVRGAFRRSDLVARVGGDEFAVLAPAVSGEPAEMLAGRVRQCLAEFNAMDREPYELKASLGVARFDSGGPVGLESLLAAADANMYEEKRSKNKVATP